MMINKVRQSHSQLIGTTAALYLTNWWQRWKTDRLCWYLHLLLSICQHESHLNSPHAKPRRLYSAGFICITKALSHKIKTALCSYTCDFFFTLLPFVATLLLQTSVRSSSPYAPWSSGSGRTSRRSSWNSLGRAPSYKRQKRQSGERRSLLSGEGGSSSEDGEGGGEGGGGLMEEDDASLARTDSMSQSQRGPRHRRMESVETRSSMDLPPDALLQVDPSNSYQFKPRTNC